MKTPLTLKKALVEKELKNLEQALPMILFTLFFSILSISNGGYLLAGSSISDASADTREDSKGASIVSFQGVQDVDEVHAIIEWEKTIGGSDYDELHSAIPTPDGGYLLAGRSASSASGDKSEDSKGYIDYWIVKIDDQGNKQWDNTIGANSGDYIHSTLPTPDGGYLLAGSSESDASGDKSGNSKGSCDEYGDCDFDYWIVKIDANGNKLWDKTIGGNRIDDLRGAISTPDGGYLLAGFSRSDASGDKSENSKGESDYWIVKIDTDGNKLWDKTIGGSGFDQVNSAIPTPDGGYLLAGDSKSDASGDKSENSRGDYDYWVVKIDADGNKLWDKTIGGNSYDEPYSTIPILEGGYLLAGFSRSDASGDKSEDSKGSVDYWIVKIDADGNKLWDKTIGGNNYDEFPIAIPATDGGYLLAGFSGSDASGDKSENSKGLGDYWIVKIDADGNKLWDKTIGGIYYDVLQSAIPISNGGYLLAGSSYSDASGDKGENRKGNSDYWIVKVKELNAPAVMSLTLLNAKTDQEIRELKDGDVINRAEIGSALLSIRANAFSKMIDQVRFDLKGPITHQQVEKIPPYALFGDFPTGDFKGREWLPGNYTLTVTPYTKDKKGAALTVSFEVTDALEITGFTLIETAQDRTLGKISEGDVINLASFSNLQLTLRADTEPVHVDQVTFTLEGPITHMQTEREFPYALFGDFPTGNFKGRKWLPGNYTLTATPYAQDSMGVSSTITFTVIDSRGSSPEAAARQVKIYPIPTSDVINILHEEVGEESHLMLLDFKGKMLLHQPMSQQPLEQVDLSGFKKGTYYLRVVSAQGVQVFRVAKE